jgi:hypothetical protein
VRDILPHPSFKRGDRRGSKTSGGAISSKSLDLKSRGPVPRMRSEGRAVVSVK